MKIAVEGCCHGALDEIYETIEQIEQRDKIKVDLLLICGDFQAIRNKTDFHAMAVPMQHKKLNTFYKYYSGEKEAPVLTIFIGGNHEASNYLQQLPYGGWVAKNIYYMGYAGVLNFGGVRIAGVSGIHKGVDYYKGHFERPPYDANSIRSCYHTRELEIYRLKQIKEPVDIMLSHDWPCGIYNYGNVNQLLRKKKFFQDEVKSNTLGSKPLEELLYEMQPKYWFAAHLHVKFAAKVQHSESGDKITKFLSLDKCLPFRQFLQVVDFPNESPKVPSLSLDPEWLCILKATNHLLNLQKYNSYIARNRSHGKSHVATEEQKKIIEEDFQGNFTIPPPGEFDETKVFNPTKENAKGYKAPLPQIEINPQTELLITMLDITDPFSVFSGIQKHSMEELDLSVVDNSKCEDSAIMDDGTTSDVDDRESSTFIDSSLDHTTDGTFNTTSNPDEISLSDDEEDAASSADQDVLDNSNSSHCASENVELNDSSSVSKMCESFSLQVPISNTGETQELELSINKNNLQGSSTPIISQKPRSHSNLSPLILQPLEGSPVVASTPVHKLQKRSSPSLNDSIASETESTDAGGNSSQSDSPVKPKKFKRRNQSMYSSADEN